MKPSINLLFLTFMSIVLISGCEKDEPNDEESLILKGNVINNTGCKSIQLESDPNYTPDTLSCIEYSFDSENKILSISHYNAGFNCGTNEVSCEVSLINDTLSIQEVEHGLGANCYCLFDVEIELSGVEQKKYQFKLNEDHAYVDEKIAFEIDLTTNITGTYCSTRKHYPWGNSLRH